MEHPLISNLDNLSEDDLLQKITELNKKLGIALSGGNNYLCNQLRMAIETYQNKYQEKIKKGPNSNFDEIIDIS
jgi:20S proteasome alpha/beta subunit